ncbi:MAG: hypothetical protein H6553_02720 [Chitinophagales bacterium]|nr:hypothetical protein [Chitinophagales bacterium]
MNKVVKNILIKIVFFTILIVFVASIVIAKNKRDNKSISDLQIEFSQGADNLLITKDDIYYYIVKYYPVHNNSVSGKQLEDIEQSVSKIPFVQSAQAFLDNNNLLRVKVTPRTPIARVFASGQSSFYIDNEGVMFPTSKNYTVKVPIITGKINQKYIKNDTINNVKLLQVLQTVKTMQQDEFMNALVGQININSKNQIELIPRLAEHTIVIGDDKDLEDKFNRLKIFYKEVLTKVGWEKYKVINIMYKEQLVGLK